MRARVRSRHDSHAGSQMPEERQRSRRLYSRSKSASPSRYSSRSSGRRSPDRKRRRHHRSSSSASSDDVHLTKHEMTMELAKQSEKLPAATHRDELLSALASHQVVICVGETGSGKTTQIPQYLHKWGKYTQDGKCVAITQPRRVATVSVAQRVADEMGTSVGGDGFVGYAIRFDDHTSGQTRIKFMTDGVLVRECLQDPMLTKYSVVMLDEAHERSIHTDILFGLLKQLVAKRPDFRLLVTSATLDSDRFAAFFTGKEGNDAQKKHFKKVSTRKHNDKAKDNGEEPLACSIVKIPGRSFPVDIFHSKQMQIMGKKGPISTYVRSAVETTLQVHNSEPEGHILVFLTGQNEIEDACDQIRMLHRQQMRENGGNHSPKDTMELRVLPLYGALQEKLQRWIFDPVPKSVRKVIVATNIAETSLTIDGIRYVIDCGFTKQKVYNPSQQMESLIIVPISKVSAQQRAGRAGRTAPGKCYRLFSKESYEQMMEETIPEIQRSNLANTVLYLKLLGIHDVVGFPYLDPPDKESILDALKQLFMLGALDDEGHATPLGKLMSAFPLEPKLSRALIEAMILNCGSEMVKIVSMLSVENVFVQKSKKVTRSHGLDDGSDENGDNWEQIMLRLKDEGLVSEHGDHLSYLEIFRTFGKLRQHNQMEWCENRQLRLRALRMAVSIENQLRDIMQTIASEDVQALKAGKDSDNRRKELSIDDRLRKSICAGFFMNATRRCTMQTVYRSLNRDENNMQLVHIHPLSTINYVAPPEYCVYQEFVVTSKPFMRAVGAVDGAWLDEYGENKLSISDTQLFALCGRSVPLEHAPHVEEIHDETHREQTKQSTAPLVTPKVSADAISQARARFLNRKKLKS